MDELDTLYQRAFDAYRAGQMGAAEQRLDELLDRSPTDARAMLLKSVVHTKAEPAVCLAMVEQAVHLDPFNAETWYNLAVFEGERGRLETALVVSGELVPLFQASFPTARVFQTRVGRFAGDHPPPAWLPELGEVDHQTPIGGLMHRLRTCTEGFSDPQIYLRSSEEARLRWEQARREENTEDGRISDRSALG